MIKIAFANDEVLTIQDVDDTPTVPKEIKPDFLGNMLPMVLIFIVFYFFLIRPQALKRKEQDEMIAAVKIGEKIITNSGIFGVVRKIDDSDNIIILEIALGSEIKVLKNTIAEVISTKNKKVKEIEKAKKRK